MEQLALQLPQYSIYQPNYPLKTILLSLNEIKCLEMAIVYLQAQLVKPDTTLLFQPLSETIVCEICDWLRDSHRMKLLHTADIEQTAWPLLRSNAIDWLIFALETGMTEDCLLTMAADQANFDYDMATLYDSDEKQFSLAELAWHDNYRSHFDHYHSLLVHKPTLLAKFHILR